MLLSNHIVIFVSVVMAIYAGLLYSQETCKADFFKNDGSYATNDVIYLDTGYSFCTGDNCHHTPYETLEIHYSGLFKAEIENNIISNCPGSNNDACCPTKVELAKMDGNTGDFHILKLRRNGQYMYQYVTNGTCCPGATCVLTGSSCVQEYASQTLLVKRIGSGSKREFRDFSFPVRCSCKNIHG